MDAVGLLTSLNFLDGLSLEVKATQLREFYAIVTHCLKQKVCSSKALLTSELGKTIDQSNVA